MSRSLSFYLKHFVGIVFEIKVIVSMIISFTSIEHIYAQVLPKGIGAYALGYRQYSQDAQL
jgi:hypothetical protein